ncbi:MAG: ABC transporter ATP-binding protein [Nocardioidaceae bacterium]|nr:ABC transporter ATP-binding protein [Nocardioidaceae bacterium]NUS53049.1 ABC transporter ATP-binding protein [Nocardioidaceae bacterium]
MSRVKVSSIDRSFGTVEVLRGVDLEIADGELLAVLGPSGCGKTTLLRIIAGFLEPDAGSIAFDGETVVGPGVSVPSRRRRVGYVPQEGALFPHLDVRGNVLFGLPRKERTDDRLAELLELAELPTALASSYPHELSGGQQQRVALARALAPRPRVVLLDEPFSSLDAALRVHAGRAVTRVLRAAGTTGVLVTHDQGEALSLADRVAVMRSGRIAQLATPHDLYRRPVDAEIASFVGGATALPGTLDGDVVRCALGALHVDRVRRAAVSGTEVTVVLRPEQVRVVAEGEGVAAVVDEVAFFGPFATVRLTLDTGADVTARVEAGHAPLVGDRVGVTVAGEAGVYA